MAKRLVIRGGQKILGSLGSGIGDPILTKDATTSELGTIGPIDPSAYLTTSLPSTQIFVGSSLGIAAAVSVSGALSITNTGVASINPDVITNANINSGAGIVYSKLSLTNSIVNNDVATNANIVRTKLAAGSANRIVITNSSGVMVDANTITPNRVLVSDINGIPIDSTLTTTVLGYIDPTSSIQTQLNNRLAFSSSITPNEGDLVVFQSGVWNSFPRGSSGQYLTSTVGGLAWTTTPNGLPVGGAANEVLRKIDSTDYNTEWHTLVIADLTDITASAAQVNVLATGYYDATSSIQTQFSFKLNNALANNAMFVGNSSNQVSQLAPGSNGQVLTIVAGVPQWQTVSGTGTVTSVAFSGGSTGLTVTGSPITTSGTITLTGTLGIANGGTNITSYTTGDLPYASSSTVLSKLGIGTNGYVLTVSGGLPSWQPNVATTPLTTKGDIFVYSTTNDRLPVGTDGYHLTADSTDPTGLKWTAPVFNPFSDLNPILYNNADNTKLARLDVSSVTTGTTRVYTLPDFNGTIALLGSTNGAALSKVDDTNVTLTLSAGSGTALLNATTITAGWTGTLADGRITSSGNWNTAYNRSGTSLGFTSSTFTFTKQDTSTLTVAVPTFNQNTTGSAAALTTTRNIALTGDAAWNVNFNGSADVTAALTLSTVNSNVGTFGSATKSTTFTVNGKGLITAASEQTVTPAVGSITGLGTGIATWLATPSSANLAAAITDETGTGALVFAGSPAFTGTLTYGTLSYSDTDIAFSFQKSVNSYFQTVWQNTNTGATASTDLIISSDNGTATTHYLDLGKNSSGFTGTGSLNQAGYSYITSTTDDLVIGTTTANGLHFLVNSSTTDSLAISSTGVITLASNVNGSVWNSTWTATTNSQISKSITDAITLRATASDTATALYINPSLALGSTTQNPVGLNLDVNFVQTGGVSTTTASTTTVAGMTATTYTNVAPASTSGSGTGALFTVVVGSATSITSITQTTAGSGYKVNETITFNGSQFGSGSGSAIFIIRTVSGVSLGTSASALRVGVSGSNFLDAPKIVDFYYQGTSIGYIGAENIFGTDLAFYDRTSLNFRISNASGAVFAKAVVFQSTLSAGTTTFTGTISNSTSTGGSTVNSFVFNSTGAVAAITQASSFASRYKAGATFNASAGLVATVSLTTGGTGYTTGTKTTTGGTGTGAQISITTVSGGVITVINTTPVARGTSYTVNDVLTLSGGTGGTVTVTAVDYAGSIISFEDANSITDAYSNNSYATINSHPTYNITSTQVGATWLAYYNPTYTAIGSFTKGGIAIVPTGTVNGIGTGSPNGTLHIVGSGSIPTLKTVGVGTGTNYSYRAFQSDGTTAILNLQDNGNFSIPVAASLSGFGTSSQTSTLESGGSLGAKTTSVSTNTTLDATYFTVRVDASGANRTITLPTASGCTGRIYVILKSDNSANTVTISTTAGGDKVINTQYSGYQVQSNGTAYNVIGSF